MITELELDEFKRGEVVELTHTLWKTPTVETVIYLGTVVEALSMFEIDSPESLIDLMFEDDEGMFLCKRENVVTVRKLPS
jgi:hypothetical protein